MPVSVPVGDGVVTGPPVLVAVVSGPPGPVAVPVGPPVQDGEGCSEAQAHTALAASRTGMAPAAPQDSSTQFNAAPLILEYVSGSHWHQKSSFEQPNWAPALTMQSVAHGGIADAEASHWIGPGVAEQGVPVSVSVGGGVVSGPPVQVVVVSGPPGAVVVVSGPPVPVDVPVGPPVQEGAGYSEAHAHTALAASITGRAPSMPQAPRTQFNAAPLMLAYVSGSH